MTNSRALDGVTVLDATQILAGPFCTMHMSDMGANVIKIEKPGGGDDTRRIGPPFINGVLDKMARQIQSPQLDSPEPSPD